MSKNRIVLMLRIFTAGFSCIRILSAVTLWLAVLVFLPLKPLHAQGDAQELNRGWSLWIDEEEFVDAAVPGCVFTDLMTAGMIPDPFAGSHEGEVAWVSERSWVYTLRFCPDPAVLSREKQYLLFKGLDTHAQVYLNDTRILSAHNQFREWRVEVGSLLKASENTLTVVFSSPVTIDDSLQSRYGLTMPGGNRVFSRKGQYQYGWDWAPALPSMGIWKPVFLLEYDHFYIEDIQMRQTFDGDDFQSLEATFSIFSWKNKKVVLTVKHPDVKFNRLLVELKPGLNRFSVPVEFKKEVQLWWPAGLGNPHLYRLSCRILSPLGRLLAVRDVVTGIRKSELVTEKDSLGETFYFKINGLPVFAKGANWVPPDHFPSRTSFWHYHQLLQEVEFAGMNMLRVWGGGVYENDVFYRLCDEKGIMVWQDFMFACGMYPGSEDMMLNIREESRGQIQRLRNHPSVVLWCGNNEVSEGWHRWGWPSGYSSTDSARLWTDYLSVFHQLLPDMVEQYGGGVQYWPSSPMLGRGDPDHVRRGDAHYWGVWHDAEPFGMYRKKVPRFMSEFGFQSFPSFKTIQGYITEDDPDPYGEEMLTHQKHPRGNALIDQYMAEWLPKPDDLSQHILFSQMLQADAVSVGIIAHRTAKPGCMGSLYWQLNDCWPAVSWSSMDYLMERKALHYAVKRNFAPQIAVFSRDGAEGIVTVVNDDPKIDSVDLDVRVLSLKGDAYYCFSGKVPAPFLTRYQWRFGFPDTVVTDSLYLCYSTVKHNNRIVSERVDLPVAPRLLPLDPEARIHLISQPGISRKELTLYLSADSFVYAVFIEADGIQGSFSDNFFPLVPGIPREVKFFADEIPEVSKFTIRKVWPSIK